MVTLKGHKRCDHQDPADPEFRCQRQPSFNFFGSVGGRFCHQHKVREPVARACGWCHLIEFWQMAGMVNVVNKCCEHEGCVKRPSFNFPNLRPARFCGQVFESPQYINARQHPPVINDFPFRVMQPSPLTSRAASCCGHGVDTHRLPQQAAAASSEV